MIDSMPITTKWNRLFDWRYADISPTNVLDDVKQPTTCFLSANAWGLKGYLPGCRHSWIATFNGYAWRTYEITDLETVEIQNGRVFYARYRDPGLRQLIISDRNPSTKWFNSTPRVDYSTAFLDLNLADYPLNFNVNLTSNNCNTLTSYVAWQHNLSFNPLYVGFKSKKYWDYCTDK